MVLVKKINYGVILYALITLWYGHLFSMGRQTESSGLYGRYSILRDMDAGLKTDALRQEKKEKKACCKQCERRLYDSLICYIVALESRIKGISIDTEAVFLELQKSGSRWINQNKHDESLIRSLLSFAFAALAAVQGESQGLFQQDDPESMKNALGLIYFTGDEEERRFLRTHLARYNDYFKYVYINTLYLLFTKQELLFDDGPQCCIEMKRLLNGCVRDGQFVFSNVKVFISKTLMRVDFSDNYCVECYTSEAMDFFRLLLEMTSDVEKSISFKYCVKPHECASIPTSNRTFGFVF
jgi:hypothetical protein